MDFLTQLLLVAALVLLFQLLKRSEQLSTQLRELRGQLEKQTEVLQAPPSPRY